MEENNSILLNLCTRKNFEEIFTKFPQGAAFLSPSLKIIWANDNFKNIILETCVPADIGLSPVEKGAQIKYVESRNIHGFLLFLPIIYRNQFLGYTVVFMPGEKADEHNFYELNAVKHDLNNLLTIVLNLISNTAETELITDGIKLTKDLLSDFSFDYTAAEKLSLYDVLNTVSHSFADPAGKGISFKSKIPASLYPVKISKSKFIRVISNLITNAFEAASSGGTVTLSAFNLNEEENDFACVCVADDGCGIQDENLKSIFEKDFSTKERGSGFGLSIVKKIMDDLGGKIVVKSEPGAGSKFILKFPVTREDKKHIAIIEDETMLNEVLTSQFSDDYSVYSFTDGESFLEKASVLTIDLVIVDKKLPGMDGIECIRLLRNTNKTIKIILASGSETGGDAAPEGIEINKFVKKPYNFDQLFSAVEELLA